MNAILLITFVLLAAVAALIPRDARRKALRGGTTLRRFSARRGPVRLVGGQAIYGRW